MSCDKLIGPALPPMFRKSSDEDSDDEQGWNRSSRSASFLHYCNILDAGPALPPGYKRGDPSSSSDDSDNEVVFKRAKSNHSAKDGPTAEKRRKCEETAKTQDDEDDDDDDDDDGFFGPALPPGFKKQQSSPERPPVLGPALPPGFRRAADDDDEDGDSDDDGGFLGPALPQGYTAEPSSDDDDDGDEEEDMIGPMPAKGDVQYSVAKDFELRAQRMRDKLTKKDEGPEEIKRETWMTELPPELQHIGLGARTFRKKTGPENKDRSMWTDTPADRERKARERLEGKKSDDKEKDDAPQMSYKDLQMADKVSKYNESKRGESLMDLHTKKRKAEENVSKPVERRPFDRDNDLQVNRFDEAQKQRLLKKSQELNTRFSHSKDRMFL